MPRLLPLVALVLLAGCGQKGPLYLPAAPAPVPATGGVEPAPAAPVPAASPESESRERALPAAQP